MTSNEAISAIKQVVKNGYRVSFWEALGRMSISVTKDGKEVASYMDAVIGDKVKIGSAINEFSADMIEGEKFNTKKENE